MPVYYYEKETIYLAALAARQDFCTAESLASAGTCCSEEEGEGGEESTKVNPSLRVKCIEWMVAPAPGLQSERLGEKKRKEVDAS